MRDRVLLRFRNVVRAPAVSGAEHLFQRQLMASLVARGHAPHVDLLGNVSVMVTRSVGPVVMVAAFVDEPGWFVREVDADGLAALEPVGSPPVVREGTLVSRRGGRLSRVILGRKDDTTSARCAPGARRVPRIGEAVAPGWGCLTWRVTWSVALLEALLEQWRRRAFHGTLAVCFLTRGKCAPRSVALCSARVRPDFALFVDGSDGLTERIVIPCGPALFDPAQQRLEGCAIASDIPFDVALAGFDDAVAAVELQRTPPGCQTAMVRFTTCGEHVAPPAAAALVDEFLVELLAGAPPAEPGPSPPPHARVRRETAIPAVV